MAEHNLWHVSGQMLLSHFQPHKLLHLSHGTSFIFHLNNLKAAKYLPKLVRPPVLNMNIFWGFFRVEGIHRSLIESSPMFFFSVLVGEFMKSIVIFRYFVMSVLILPRVATSVYYWIRNVSFSWLSSLILRSLSPLPLKAEERGNKGGSVICASSLRWVDK